MFYSSGVSDVIIIDNCPPFRPILSAVNTPTYRLAKFLVPILKSLTGMSIR